MADRIARLNLSAGQCVPLEARGTMPAQAHVFDQKSIDAVNAALAARRPLLVLGEPGTGKSQLARAAAAHLGRPLITKVIDGRTDARDLLWEFDAVARLAEAQLMGALRSVGGKDEGHRKDEDQLRKALAPCRFVRPGPLWWSLAWKSAEAQRGQLLIPAQAPRAPQDWVPGKGCVLLIDEIDKGESDVPNGLLEALGEGLFHPPGRDEPVEFDGGQPPLVVITTNEERSLPNAFVRRCLALRLALPALNPKSGEQEKQEKLAFVSFLIDRGRAHFGAGSLLSSAPRAERGADQRDAVFERAAELLLEDRLQALEQELPPPGLAEYLDLLRVVHEQARAPAEQLALLGRLREYVYQKHSLAGE